MTDQIPRYDYNIREDERVEITKDDELIGLVAKDETFRFLHVMDFFYDSLSEPSDEDNIPEWIEHPQVQDFLEIWIKTPENMEKINGQK